MTDFNTAINNIQNAINSNSIDSINRESLELAIYAIKIVDSLKITEFVAGIANSDGALVEGTQHKVVLLYNSNAISDADLNKIVNDGSWEFDPRVICINEEQAKYINMSSSNND